MRDQRGTKLLLRELMYGTAQPTPASTVVRLRRRAGRGPSVAPGDPGTYESAADDAPTTL
jgi:hypothetical protein